MYSEEQAQHEHARKSKYTVLVGSVDRPFCFLDITDIIVAVGFLDEHLRERLTYAFQEVSGNRLFLSSIVYRDYKDDSDEITNATMYLFAIDGNLHIERTKMHPVSSEVSTSTVDISHNFTGKPTFGNYDDLIRIESNSRLPVNRVLLVP